MHGGGSRCTGYWLTHGGSGRLTEPIFMRIACLKSMLACLRRDETRIDHALGRELNGLDVLIIGPGPYLIEPRFFGQRNHVTAINLDVIPRGLVPREYFRMLRQNGFGWFAKTVGRKCLGVDRRHARVAA